jgi:hypothetical protein
MSEDWDEAGELQLHDPFRLPDTLELEHEINRPKWWYAHQLRLAGATWDEIAKALDYGSGPSAHMTVKRELTKAEVTQTSRSEALALELERLDMLQLVVWRQARQGDLKAIDTVLRIMNQRAKYYGLDTQTIEDDGQQSKAMIVIGGDEEDYLAAVREAQNLHKKPIEGELA